LSLADPEGFIKTMNRLDTSMGHFNKVVAGLTRVIDKNIRAQTKVVAAANKTHGVMLGVVADLELMGGAFGKVKGFLANILLPVDESTPKFFKYAQGLMSLSNAYTNLWTPFKQHLKAKQDESKAQKKLTNASQISITGLSQVNSRMNLFGNLMKDTKSMIPSILPSLRGIVSPAVSPGGGTIIHKRIPGIAPTELTGLKPLEEIAKPNRFKALREMGSSKMKTAMGHWKKNVTTPIKQIASGGIGLGFQVHIVMALMQSFASLFAIFQPIMDVVGLLMERLSVGFIPIVTMLINIITSPPVLAMIDALSLAMYEFFEIFKPLTPIIISMIGIALMPLMMILGILTPTLEMLGMIFGVVFIAISPLFDLLSGPLAGVFGILTNLLSVLLVAGLYPLVGAIYIVGLGIAALMDFFTAGAAGAIANWNTLMLPIFGAMGTATMGVLGSFQVGTDFVPQTGIYHLTRGEGVRTVEENREPISSPIVINMYGSYLGADMEDLSNRLAKKLSLHRF
jgi:hypothetical protein